MDELGASPNRDVTAHPDWVPFATTVPILVVTLAEIEKDRMAMSTAAEKPKRTAFAPDPWVRAIICHPSVKRSAENVAWLLSSDAAFTTDGCTAGDVDIASQLGLARNSIKNAIIILRVHGFIEWSWSSIDGVRIRTIRPVFVREATAPIGPALHWGDASAPAAGAMLSPDEGSLLRRVRRSGSGGAVRPMPEPPADQTPEPASTAAIPPDIVSEMPDRTHSECDTDPVLRAHEMNEHAPDTTRGGDLLGVLPDPPLSDSTQTGCGGAAVRRSPALREPKQARTRRYDPTMPLWMQTTAVQNERAARHVGRLPWDARCGHDHCGSRNLAFICADEGDVFCAWHRREANVPVALAKLDPDRRW